MKQGFLDWLDAQQGRQYELHERHLNPAFVKMIRTIGFDKSYIRGQGEWLFDSDGHRYLDLLTGWGMFALGRNHPRVRTILEATLCMKWTIHTRWSYRSAGEDSRADRCSLQFGAQQRSTQRSGSDWQ